MLAYFTNDVMLYPTVLVPFLVLTSTVTTPGVIEYSAQLLMPEIYHWMWTFPIGGQLHLEGGIALTAVRSHRYSAVAAYDDLRIRRCSVVDGGRVRAATAVHQESRLPHLPSVVGSGTTPQTFRNTELSLHLLAIAL